MLEFRFDTQLLIEGHGLDEDAIHDDIQRNIAYDNTFCSGKSTYSKTCGKSSGNTNGTQASRTKTIACAGTNRVE